MTNPKSRPATRGFFVSIGTSEDSFANCVDVTQGWGHGLGMQTTPAKKNKVNFPCCNIIALGHRGMHRTESGISKYAQCPKCGKRFNLNLA